MESAALKYQQPLSPDRTPSEQTLVRDDQLSRQSLASSTDVAVISPAKSFCQRLFGHSQYLLACLCLCTITQGFLINGIISVSVTTLERRFHLNSKQSGFYGSMYDVAVLIVLFPVCHYGGRGHKGRWLAVGMVIMAIGSIICTIPQFASDPYEYDSEADKDPMCHLNSTRPVSKVVDDSTVSRWYYVLLLGQLLHGIGAAPIYTLGIAYLDENVHQESSPLYMGTYLASSIVGPVMAYLLGGVFLNIYGDIGKVDVSKIDITPSDSDWYGAWWLGYLLAAMMAFTASLPLFGFPHTLPGFEEKRLQDVNQAHHHTEEMTQIGFGSSLAEFKKSIKILFRNPTFMLLVLVDCLEGLADTGVVLYMPKIIETYFSKTPSQASFYTGMVAVPAALFGNVVSGAILRKFKLRCGGMIMFSLVVNCFLFWLMLVFLAHCPQPPFAGFTADYPTNDKFFFKDVKYMCNSDCSCSRDNYMPVCSGDLKMIFFSPCYAGCQGQNRTDATSVYSNCSCLGNFTTSGVVKEGVCESDCAMLPVFLTFFALLVTASFLTSIPIQQAELRSVPFGQRTVALGVRWILLRLLGTIPGPIMFGSIIDSTCLVWEKRGDVNLECVWYDNQSLSRFITIAGMSLKGAVGLSLLLAYKLYRPKELAPRPA